MHILITGGAGFIGSHLAEKLLQEGNQISAIDNFDPFYSRTIKESNIAGCLGKPGYTLYENDIRDASALRDIFSKVKVDFVVHLAAKAGVRPSLENPKEYYDVNLNGTLALLEVMRENNVKKMVFASSSSVYGNSEQIPFSESDNVDHPISPYAASKKAGELLCHTYHHLYGYDIFCMRFFTVFGPRQRPDLAIHKFTKAITENKPIQVYGKGDTSRDYTYVADIVSGLVEAIKKVNGYEIINLGNSRTVPLAELISLIEKHLQMKAVIKYLPEQPGDVKKTHADIKKAKLLLGYNPQHGIDEGIDDFVEWFRLQN